MTLFILFNLIISKKLLLITQRSTKDVTCNESRKKREILRIKARFSLAVYIYGIPWRNVSFPCLKSILIFARKSHLDPFILKNSRALLRTSWITDTKKSSRGSCSFWWNGSLRATSVGVLACVRWVVFTIASLVCDSLDGSRQRRDLLLPFA